MNPSIEIRDNWDGTCSVFVDGKVILERKSRLECEEKAQFCDAFIAVILASKEQLTADAGRGSIETGGTHEVTDEGRIGQTPDGSPKA
jgi:hypothetical protein